MVFFVLAWSAVNYQQKGEKTKFEFFLRTVAKSQGEYLKIILRFSNKDMIENLFLTTPAEEMINLNRDDFKKELAGVLISRELKVDKILPGEYSVKLCCANGDVSIRTINFAPLYCSFPENTVVKNSTVSWQPDDDVLMYKIEVKQVNGNTVWRSNYIRNKHLNKYFLDTRRLEEGREYKVRIKSYDGDVPYFFLYGKIYGNESITGYQRFYYHKNTPQLLSWQIRNVELRDFIDGRTFRHAIWVSLSHPWSVRKIVCIGLGGERHKMRWIESRQFYIAFPELLEDGIYRLKIYPAEGEPMIVRKYFHFDPGYIFAHDLKYKDRKISWRSKEKADLYQVWIYREKREASFFKKIFHNVTKESVLLDKGNFTNGRNYCFMIVSIEEVYGKRSVNECFSALQYFAFP